MSACHKNIYGAMTAISLMLSVRYVFKSGNVAKNMK